MKTLEEHMAESLRGQFFWERTIGGSYVDSEMSNAIRKAQMEFRDPPLPKVRPSPQISEEDRQKLNVLLEVLVKELSLMYDVDPSEFMGRSRKKKAAFTRNKLGWLLRRYHKKASLERIGMMLRRDHSTVVNMIHSFGKVADQYKENIAYLDAIVGFKEE